MLLRSLRLRILLTFALVLVASLGAVAFAVHQFTIVRFQQYVVSVSKQDQLAMGKLLTLYRASADPKALQGLVDEIAASSDQRVLFVDRDQRVVADSAHNLMGQQIKCQTPGDPASACFTPEGSIPPPKMVVFADAVLPPPQNVAVVAGNEHTKPVAASAPTEVFPIDPGGKNGVFGHTGVAASAPAGRFRIAFDPSFSDDATQFIRSVDRALLLAAGLGGALALLLTFVLSARILRPVQALTCAAGEMERGDLAQRVPVRGHDELGVLARAFNAMADSVARAERLRRMMLGDVAHDLRTPLTNIRGYLEALQDGVLRPTPQVFRSLQDEVLLLNRLVNDLQDLAQAEAGQLRFDCQPLDLGVSLRQAVAVVEPQAEAKGVRLDVEAPKELPLVLADAGRVGQVLGNLLQNAITAMPDGGRVTLSAIAGDEVKVQVADTGVGIPPEHLPNVFERFYRVDPSRNRATGGSGLGLAIVKQLVEQQGGHVVVESQPGKGSVFCFTLPLAPAGAVVV